MKFWNVLLWCLGVLAAMFAFAAVSAWWERKRPNEDYDERQKLIQGKAHRFGSYACVAYCLAAFCWQELGNEFPVKTSTMLFIAILVEILAYHVYCLVQDAALPLGNKGKLVIISDCLIFFSSIMNYRNKVKYAEAYEAYIKVEPDTTLPAPSGIDDLALLLMAITSGALALMYLLQMMWHSYDD